MFAASYKESPRLYAETWGFPCNQEALLWIFAKNVTTQSLRHG